MALEITNGQLPAELRNIIHGGECVVFIGSGLSAKYYGTWPELVNKLCKACKIDRRVDRASPPDDFLDAAQDAKDADCAAYLRFLGTHFGSPVDQAYDHKGKKRANNPPVGLVTPETAPDRGKKKTYEYAPQLVWAGKAER